MRAGCAGLMLAFSVATAATAVPRGSLFAQPVDPSPPGGAAVPEALVRVPADADNDPWAILTPEPAYFRFEAVNLAFTHFVQRGRGFQSRAGPASGPGLEDTSIEQPQAELIARQGKHLTHRIWVPIDIVTAASPDAVDIVSTASKTNEAGSFDWTVGYADVAFDGAFRVGFHSEENFHSWNVGLGVDIPFAEENTILSASFNDVFDWFDDYRLDGSHSGHVTRNALNGNVGVTQLLSPSTIAHAEVGSTVQSGDLSNGWNIVPLSDGTVVQETLPKERFRNAFVLRMAQYLPFEAALRGSYRFYADDWGLFAHSGEFELQKRLAAFSRLRLSYRVHDQTSVSFFTTRGSPLDDGEKTADSDLASFGSHTVGFAGIFDFEVPFAKSLHLDFGIDRYLRTNDLQATLFALGAGLLFL